LGESEIFEGIAFYTDSGGKSIAKWAITDFKSGSVASRATSRFPSYTPALLVSFSFRELC
jgi:hypothetical protein